jgi:hypothetical protein
LTNVFRRTGITFNVYGANEAEERLIPFDIVPAHHRRGMARLTRGIEQRVRAINAFLHDIYHRQEIIRAGRLAEELVAKNSAFLPQMIGFTPPGGVYTHIVGIDLVRTGEDEFMVLEDNARTPSGVSYMLENRETMMAMFPELFSAIRVRRSRLSEAAAPLALEPPARRRLRWAPRGGGADAGHLQQRLFRTCLPGRPDGRRTGRGPATCASSTAASPCAPRKATSRSTCSIAASTTISSIR